MTQEMNQLMSVTCNDDDDVILFSFVTCRSFCSHRKTHIHKLIALNARLTHLLGNEGGILCEH